MPDQPNIIVFMSDEHDPAVTGCYGDPLVRTPHLDRLAAEGVTFDNCYTASPLCVPARLAFTAGQYVSRCSAWNNSAMLPSDDYPSLPRVLRAAGYQPLLCGKQHYDKSRRYGFTDLIPGLHSNNGVKQLNGGRREPADTTTNHQVWLSRSSQFYPADHGGILDHDRTVSEHAIDFLRQRQRDDGPFFLFVGHLAPHFPLIVPQQYYDHYRGRVPMPDIPDGMLDDLPLNYKHLRYGFGLTDTDPEVVQKGRDLYWALTEWFDNEVGQVLAALNASDVADDTVVIYTSDHGENKGDHGLWWKNNMYDHAARIPLIAHYPQRWEGGQRRAEACGLLDVVRTIIDLADGEAPDTFDGDSLLPWLDDADHAWKDTAVSEYYGHNVASGFTMIRQGKYKYVYHTRMNDQFGPERELYDMQADPGEQHNLARAPDHEDVMARMHKAMVAEIGREPDDIEQQYRAEISRAQAHR